jgi:hypothetical protein
MLSFLAMSNFTPQFGTAEYLGSPGVDHCQLCQQPIAGEYYRANAAIACPPCAQNMRGALAKDTHAAFVRGLLFGIGAAIVGLVLYATFTIMTGLVIGYVSLAVGWMVGKAMMKGSHGIGGRRYQIAAVLLTYAAVSMAAVPIALHYARQPRQNNSIRRLQQKQAPTQNLQDEQRRLEQEFGNQKPLPTPTPETGASSARAHVAPSPLVTAQHQEPAPAQPPSRQRRSRGEVILRLALLGLFSPFVELWEVGPSFGWIIGLVILFVGMRFAWTITAGRAIEIFGPFDSARQPQL